MNKERKHNNMYSA